MQPKKDQESSEIEEVIEEESPKLGRAVAARGMKVIAMLLGGLFMIYNLFVRDNDASDVKKNSNPSVNKSALNEPLEPIKINNKSSAEVADRSQVEKNIIVTKEDKPTPKQLDKPDLPPVPDFEFKAQEKEEVKVQEVPKPEDMKLPDSIKKEEEVKKIAEVIKPEEKKIPDKPLTEVKVAQPSSPPVEEVLRRQMDVNMFAFGSGAGGSADVPVKNLSKNAEDFIIFDNETVSKEKITQDKNGNPSPIGAVVSNKLQNPDLTVARGKMITATLETAINSQLPGPVRAIVARDVYGELGSTKILIPKGSRLSGTYSSTIAVGQSRINIAFNQILRPDGVIISFNANAADQFGRTGVEGDLDNRMNEMISNSLLLSLVNVGTAVALDKILGGVDGQSQIVTPTTGTVTTTNINPVTLASQSVIQTTSDMIKQMMQNATNLQSIASLPQGTRLTLFANQDIVVTEYKPYH